MTRVKKGVHALKRRRSVLKQTKGFRHGRSTKERQAKEAILTPAIILLPIEKTKSRTTENSGI